VLTRYTIMKVTVHPVRLEDSVSVDLPRSTTEVWAFMEDPATTVALFETTEAAATLPGSPAGAGEILVAIEASERGRLANSSEVTELDVGRRVAYRSLSTWHPSGGEMSLEPLGPESCRLTQRLWADMPAGVCAKSVRTARKANRERLQEMTRRLAELAANTPSAANIAASAPPK
jgi:hypothetical protein